MTLQEFITETKTEIKDGVKYATHFVNRDIRQGDPLGNSIGTCINGVEKITEIIKYVYQPQHKINMEQQKLLPALIESLKHAIDCSEKTDLEIKRKMMLLTGVTEMSHDGKGSRRSDTKVRIH